MKIQVGSYVRITSDYPANWNLQSQTAMLRLCPMKIIQMNIWLNWMAVTLSPHLAGMLVKEPAHSLEVAR